MAYILLPLQSCDFRRCQSPGVERSQKALYYNKSFVCFSNGIGLNRMNEDILGTLKHAG